VGKDGSPLVNAALYGKIEVVKFLISKGANVNAKSNGGRTPLHAAVGAGVLSVSDVNIVAVVKLLVSNGADVNAKDNKGETPLGDVVVFGTSEVIKLLISNGANVNAKYNDGSAPIHKAARSGKIENVRLLVSKGADVNAKDNKGLTPLYNAVIGNHIEVVKFLVSQGADINMTYEKGASLRDIALSMAAVTTGAHYRTMATYLDSLSNMPAQPSTTAVAPPAVQGHNQASQGQWANGDITYGAITGILVFLTFVIYHIFLATMPDHDSEGRLIMSGGTLLVGGVISLIVLLVWQIHRKESKCPQCKRAWGKEIIRTTALDSRNETRRVMEYDTVRNSRGEIIGSVERPTTQIVTVTTYRVECQCKHCDYKWSYTNTTGL